MTRAIKYIYPSMGTIRSSTFQPLLRIAFGEGGLQAWLTRQCLCWKWEKDTIWLSHEARSDTREMPLGTTATPSLLLRPTSVTMNHHDEKAFEVWGKGGKERIKTWRQYSLHREGGGAMMKFMLWGRIVVLKKWENIRYKIIPLFSDSDMPRSVTPALMTAIYIIRNDIYVIVAAAFSKVKRAFYYFLCVRRLIWKTACF